MSTTTLTITINEEVHTLNLAVNPLDPETTLASFIRNNTTFKGTKVTCAEGGCGACTVGLSILDAATNTLGPLRPANSCLALLMSLNGATVLTNDFIGNAVKGYHPIQEKLATLNGTQCGYCASGMVMLLYTYLQSHPNPTPLEVEQLLDGNLCRCTGYRPILDAFKTFATSGDESFMSACRKANCCQKKNKLHVDVEDSLKLLPPINDNNNNTAVAASKLMVPYKRTKKDVPGAPVVTGSTTVWQDVTTLADLEYWVQHYSGLQVMLLVGGTSRAIYPKDYDVFLNISQIPELSVLSQNTNSVTIGAGNSIQSVIEFLQGVEVPSSDSYLTQHLPALIAHLLRVAGHSIRCRASIGGNLMVCHEHQTSDDFFPSDVTIAMMGIGATVSVLNTLTSATTSYSITDFLALSMAGNVLLSITVPFAQANYAQYATYKIAKRQVMSHALVNCAFKVNVSPLSKQISGKPIIAIGGVLASPTRATTVEAALVGLNVTDVTAVQTVCQTLKTWLTANVAAQGGRQAYRVQTAANYLYKFLLSLQQSTLPTDLTRASQNWMVRPVTSATQDFTTNPELYPASQPMNKVDALTQTSGEAVFTADIPLPLGTLFGAVVQSTLANATIVSVNANVAANVAGFVKYYDQTSIPASQNSFGVAPLFATGTSNYAGQSVGLVVATTRQVALRCAALIQATIQYKNQQTPVLTAQEAIAANALFPGVNFPPIQRGDADGTFASCAHVITGTLTVGSQYHVHMENNAALVQPIEGMYQIDAASQSPVTAQSVVAGILGVPNSLVKVNTRRCGGGFGAKVTNCNFAAGCAAVACKDLQKPVLMELTLQDPMRGLGARPQYLYTYKIGLDANFKMLAYDATINLAVGFTASDCMSEASTALTNMDNCYNIPNYTVRTNMYRTNLPPCTSVRGPGWIQAIFFAELMVNDVAAQLQAQGVSVTGQQLREANFYTQGSTLPTGMPLTTCNLQNVWQTAQTQANLTQRIADVATFNAANKFVKRGIALNPTRFGVDWTWPSYNASVAVYGDGSIAISHGGVEIGQGINTKVSQAAAYTFGLTEAEMPTIRVLTSTTRTSPNPTNVTGGSVTSELCSLAVIHCCEMINQRLAPFRTAGLSWELAVAAAAGAGVDMLASTTSGQPRTPAWTRYNTWGTAVTEVELDGLTGQFEIKRTDLVYDCGTSLNPYVDIGQIEGGFTFGLGWITTEGANYDATTGQARDASTWEYKPPTAYEIPEIFNVTLLPNSANANGVLSSKATGEPPVALSISVAHALEAAINAVRLENGLTPFSVTSLPLAVDVIANACGVNINNYVVA